MLLAPTPSAEDKQLHAALLSSAIASGEGLQLECADAETLRPLGITPDALRAKIESLRITFEQWHTELNPQRQAAVLREAGDPPNATSLTDRTSHCWSCRS